MGIPQAPIVGNWYLRADRPQAFQVVACDGDAGTVDVEYFDGTVDEWPLSHWHGLDIEACEAPSDWTGPFDNIEPDERDDDEPGAGGHDERARRLLEDDLREIPPARHQAARRTRRRAGRSKPGPSRRRLPKTP